MLGNSSALMPTSRMSEVPLLMRTTESSDISPSTTPSGSSLTILARRLTGRVTDPGFETSAGTVQRMEMSRLVLVSVSPCSSATMRTLDRTGNVGRAVTTL